MTKGVAEIGGAGTRVTQVSSHTQKLPSDNQDSLEPNRFG